MQDLMHLDVKTQSIMVSGQGLYKQKGMHRSAVILANGIICLQFKQLAKESGIMEPNSISMQKNTLMQLK